MAAKIHEASGIPVFCTCTRLAKLSEVRANPRNPNRHPADQIALYAQVIRENGWRRAITVSKQSGMVVRGHGALEAAQLLGVELVPIEEQQYASEAEELADMLADNRLAELSERDRDSVAAIIRELQGEGRSLVSAGYDDKSVAAILEELGEPGALVSLSTRPPPKLAWALIGVPITQFGRVQRVCDDLRGIATVIETTVTDEPKSRKDG